MMTSYVQTKSPQQDFFEKNMEALSQMQNSMLAARLRVIDPCQGRFQFHKFDKGFKVIDGAGKQADFRFNAAIKLDDRSLRVVFIGFGDGSLIHSALKNPKLKQILVYEPNIFLLKTLLQTYDYSDILSDQRCYIASDDALSGLDDQVKDFFIRDRSRIAEARDLKCFNTPGVDALFDNKNASEVFLKILSKAASCREGWEKSDYVALMEDAYRGFLNTVRNAAWYFETPHLDQLKGLCKGVPGLVVATGPSLSHSYEFIKSIANKCVISCCDSALRILHKQNIRPDFVSSLERDGAIKYLFEGVDAKDSRLVAPVSLSPESFSIYTGPKIQFTRDIGFEDWLRTDNDNQYYIGSSASHLAFLILNILGCSPIYFVGQDCAYDPFTGLSHDKNAQHYILEFGKKEKEQRIYGDQFEVEGNDGAKRLTNTIWHDFGLVIQRMVREQFGTKVYNVIPKEYGVRLKGFEHLEPEDAEAGFVDVGFDKAKWLWEIDGIEPKQEFAISQKRVQYVSQSLDELDEFCLRVLQDMSVFWSLYDLRLSGHGHEQKYEELFMMLRKYHQDLLVLSDGFFEKYFLKLVISRHSYIGIQLEDLMHSESPREVVFEKRFRLVYEWYTMLHQWISRVRYDMRIHVRKGAVK